MPPSYYLLHTQYHAAVILLHRPFVRYSEKSEADVGNPFTSLSRTSCVESAEHIATIFEQYRARFDMAQAYGTAVQHAGTAVTALMGEVILQTDMPQRDKLIEKITSLRLAISLMAKNYQPAGYMTSVVDQFIRSMQSAGLDKSEPEQRADAESSGPETAARGPAGDLPSQPHHDFVPLSQCRTRMGDSFAFTPTCSGSQSPSGLPFLPSSFLEGLIMDDTMFSGLAGAADGNLPWDYPPEL
ncbi:regulatory protein CefR [Emericellopsis cladophorae]|uniref:Regulatory protein CefR n=1 Tax=Emericellopsis cladophorae TaxID=2686198 RepID=A0A9P9Y8J9_9HYPO|nr:regulatory protein CefR [Emericellopsis cladophorae]KAI6785456.1 regulatory protein CefR [Emericellopsis cladophorae]